MLKLTMMRLYRVLSLGVLFVVVYGGTVALTLPVAHAAVGDGTPSDPNIHYTGRWGSSSSTTYTSYWGGAYFKVGFTGKTVQIKLGGSVNLYGSIDGGEDVYYPGVNGTVNLTPTPLPAGAHTLRVAARSEVEVIKFQGLVLDTGATTLPAATSNKLVEFVGDSITAGFLDTKIALSDYAWEAGEQLHVEHTQIAYQGICLTDNIQCYSPNAIGMSRQFFKLQTVGYPSSPAWDFSRYQANAVVINLGTNDNGINISDDKFKNTYVTFLQNIRAKYPNAAILVLRTFGGFKANPTQAAVNVVNAAGDQNVHYIDTTGWLSVGDFFSNDVHPTDAGQLKAAGLLAPVIASYIGVSYVPPIVYKLLNQNSGKLLDVAGGSTTDGMQVIQWPDNTGTNQHWSLVDAGGGYYKIVNQKSSEVLDVSAGSTADGAPVIQWPDRNSTNQHWRLVDAGGGYYKVINQNSGKLLAIMGASTADAATVQQFSDNGTADHLWRLEAVVPAGVNYKIINQNSTKLLAVSGASTTDGANIQQFYDSGTSDHLWHFVDVGNGYYKIVNQNSGKLLDVTGGSILDNTQVVQWTDHNGANQLWQLIYAGNGYYKFVNQNSGKLLAVSGASTADSANVTQFNDNGSLDHLWRLVWS